MIRYFNYAGYGKEASARYLDFENLSDGHDYGESVTDKTAFRPIADVEKIRASIASGSLPADNGLYDYPDGSIPDDVPAVTRDKSLDRVEIDSRLEYLSNQVEASAKADMEAAAKREAAKADKKENATKQADSQLVAASSD